MPALKERLGKSRSDKVRYAYFGPDPGKQKYATNLPNSILVPMQSNSLDNPTRGVIDVLSGAAWMDDNQAQPLSVKRLFNIFQCIPLINNREVMKMMGIEERQARRYVRAAKFALPHLEAIFSAN